LEAIRCGAKGYQLKDSDASELAAAIRAANRGESLLQPAMTTKLLERLREDRGELLHGVELNEREKEVLNLLVTGARNKEIAAKLFITEKTVESHLSHIFSKLGVSNRTEAARYAIEHGLVTPEPEHKR
jgi:DNA-binding NarL/FixJ family response regulator